MGLSNTYGVANDEESKELLRHAIKIGQVGVLHHLLMPGLTDIVYADFLGYVRRLQVVTLKD